MAEKLSPDQPFIHPDCAIHNSRFGAYCEIGQGSRILNTVFGDYSYCDRFADIANTDIGKFVNIAAMTRIGPTDHPMTGASLHHFLYRSASYWEDAEDWPEFFAQRAARVLTIGHDVWIGHGAVIRPELTIGNGAIIAAGAVVTKDVPPFTIVAGVPAKPIKHRFDAALIARIEELAWWDWDHAQLRAALGDFRSLTMAEFVDKYAAGPPA